MKLEFLEVPRNQSRKGASARTMGTHCCKDAHLYPFEILFTPSPSIQMSERGNNALSIKYLEMVWAEVR